MNNGETLSINRVLIKVHFYGKHSKTAIQCKIFFSKKDNLKEDYQKALEKITLFFLSNLVLLMDKTIKTKSGLELATSCSSGYKTSSEKLLY